MVLSDFVTAREREPGEGERGSPAAGKGMACLRVGYAPQGGGKRRWRLVDGWLKMIVELGAFFYRI